MKMSCEKWSGWKEQVTGLEGYDYEIKDKRKMAGKQEV